MLAKTIRAFIRAESGATAIEYGLIAGLIAVALLGTFAVLGNSLQGLFNNGTAETLADKAGSIK